MALINQISKILCGYTHYELTSDWTEVPLLCQIADKLTKGETLTFLLPAFPAKSPSPEKTSGELPDMGEVLGLQNLQQLCTRIGKIYAPGAHVIICSDGRVFSDVVRVSDEAIDRYNEGVLEIIEEFNLENLSLFSMDDLHPDWSGDELRDLLLKKYARSYEDVRTLVKSTEQYAQLFNGVHRFLIEDEVVLSPTLSKNQVTKETKKRAYELIRRSEAWGALLKEHFSSELRFSIHPYPIGHEKFGIKLVESSSQWATPWHNVAVKIKERFELMHLGRAKSLGAVAKFYEDKYAYFEVTTA